jgi:hypothetical protein
MLNHIRAVASSVLLLAAAPLSVNAQPTPQPAARRAAPRRPAPTLPNRVFLDLNGGFQSGTQTFSDKKDDSLYGEAVSWNADYETRSGPAFDLSGGVRVWRNLVASVTYSRFTDTNLAGIQGKVPHPFFFNQDRAFVGETVGLTQQEDVIHLGAMWAVPASRRMDVRVFGGPSLYRIQRDLVADIIHAEVGYPYDTASFDNARVERVKVDAWGFHVGGDVTWMFTQTVGVGAMARFSRAETGLTSPANGDSLSLRFGGLQFGGGLRLRFGRPARKEPPRGPQQTISEPSTPPSRPDTPEASPPERAARTTAVLKKDSPVFVRPGALAPMQTLLAGTRVTVREHVDEWLRIEFRDAKWGVRVGYVLRENCEW